ncbi:MAG: DNA primase [Clostridia bacterium]|nr:DNA primase [Clostridia bacterium]
MSGAKGFDPRFMQELKAKNNLVEVASSYVSLDRKGMNHWACCPFHHERTPSFSINEADQFYHCFGCGVSGDVVKFVQEMESTDFMGAVRILAARAKMSVPETNFDTEQAQAMKKKRDTLAKILLDSAKFYLANLYSGDRRADPHLQYISRRGLAPTTVKKFGLGASLDFNSLPDYLAGKGYSRADLKDSGVLGEKNGRLYDAQGGRLIFPIINAMDEVVAFGGRLLEKADFAKYKNTEETLLFNKRNILYNINQLKKLKREQPITSVIMVEGYMDTISLYQAGFKNVVASMGTALTKEHARLLKRYSENIYFSYDGDFAGQKNTLRGLGILEEEHMTVKVVPLPEGQDPDDVVKQGADAYQACLDKAMPLIDYRIHFAERKYDLSEASDKRRFIEEALKIVRTEQSESVREELLKKLRERTGVTYQSLERDLNNLPATELPTGYEEEVKFSASAAHDHKNMKAARFVLAAKLFSEPYTKGFDLSTLEFSDEVHAAVARYILSCERSGERIRPSALFEFLDPELPELNKLLDLTSEIEGKIAEKFFTDSVKALEKEQVEKKVALLTEAYAAETDNERRKQIAKELSEAIRRGKTLK